MPFGLGKKKKEEEEPDKSSLFSTRKGQGTMANSASNPYAAAPASNNPYASASADPYTNQAPPAYNNTASNPQFDRYRQDKSPVPSGGYGAPGGPPSSAPAPGGFTQGAAGGYGNAGGYGAGGDNPYGAGGGSGAPTSRYGAGGYGGFGRQPSTMSQDTDAGRAELFGNAPQKLGQVQQGGPPGQSSTSNPYSQPGRPGQYQQSGPVPGTWESGTGENYGQNTDYGAYQDRQLTQEEQEEEDIQAAKQEIRFIKQQDVSSTRNALRIAAQAEETGRQTLERLAQQGERIHNTERNLDLASNQNRLAAEKARELKTLNRSMFAMHVNNPFTSKSRIAEREAAVLDQARKDREVRDNTRAAAWDSQARHGKEAREMNRLGGQSTKTGSSLAERSKYQFEADSEDEAMEEEIDQNLDLLHGAAKRLNGLAGAMGREVDEQNKHIGRIGGKVDRVDDEIALNRSRLDRIK